MAAKHTRNGIVIFSGGSAANSLVDVFNSLVEGTDSTLSYIIPISDNGGSSSELIRVFGGPGIGDVRSRLIRLIPSPSPIQSLLNHRLPPSSISARNEWITIVDGTSPLWQPIAPSTKELIRPFLNLLNLELIKRARPSSTFDFSSASIGNMFLTGARLFTGSFESAIALLGMIGGVHEQIKVIPAINANWTCHIAAGLMDGSVIVGQNNISHPSAPTALPDSSEDQNHPITPSSTHPHSLPFPQRRRQPSLSITESDRIEDAYAPGTLPTLRRPQIGFSKTSEQPLPVPIARIWYINPYGSEIHPAPNPAVVDALGDARTVIYSIGSLYTSLIPGLILRGVGNLIAGDEEQPPKSKSAPLSSFPSASVDGEDLTNGKPTSPSQSTRTSEIKVKILILNGTLDRETGLGLPSPQQMSAADFVLAVVRAGEESQGRFDSLPPHPTLPSQADPSPSSSEPESDTEPHPLQLQMQSQFKALVRKYITHIIYLDNKDNTEEFMAPRVDRNLLQIWGVECVRCFGRGGRYDPGALKGAIGAILGGRDRGKRRNTES
ncbi:MAG: hypothetical protein M1834_001018 [Cirrosporium novae-zelandiae]|nr:MAG: hypothetical protein M1834_001018 [Cirrosporium novae-zelandiae]